MIAGTYSAVTITNSIQSGAAFAIKHGTGDACYIPATVMFTSNAKPGDVVEALLVNNPNDEVRDRTPYMARYIKAMQLELPLPNPAPAPITPQTPAFNRAEVEAHVRMAMKEGGVWTTLTMFRDYMLDEDAVREDNVQAYNAVSTALRKMFDEDECAKWSMWSRKSQTKVGREWFSCYPQNVEVAEWEDE